MNDIKLGTPHPVLRMEQRSAVEPSAEDGFSLSRRSVLTEKLLPARCAPVPRRKGRRPTPSETPAVLLPF